MSDYDRWSLCWKWKCDFIVRLYTVSGYRDKCSTPGAYIKQWNLVTKTAFDRSGAEIKVNYEDIGEIYVTLCRNYDDVVGQPKGYYGGTNLGENIRQTVETNHGSMHWFHLGGFNHYSQLAKIWIYLEVQASYTLIPKPHVEYNLPVGPNGTITLDLMNSTLHYECQEYYQFNCSRKRNTITLDVKLPKIQDSGNHDSVVCSSTICASTSTSGVLSYRSIHSPNTINAHCEYGKYVSGQPLETTQQLVCQCTAGTVMWENVAQECVSVRCKPFGSKTTFGALYYNETIYDNSSVQHSETLYVRCHDGYRLEGAKSESSNCRLMNKTTAQWYPNAVDNCIEQTCKGTPMVLINKTSYWPKIEHDVKYGDWYNVTCRKGFLGSYVTKCDIVDGNNVSFQPHLAPCRRQYCLKSPLLTIDTDSYWPEIEHDVMYGDNYDTVCSSGYAGSMRIKCDVDIDNRVAFNQSFVPCQEQFCNSSILNQTRFLKVAVNSELTLQFPCNDTNNDTTITPVNVTCIWNASSESAYWDGFVVPKCIPYQEPTTTTYNTTTSEITSTPKPMSPPPVKPMTAKEESFAIETILIPVSISLALIVAFVVLIRVNHEEDEMVSIQSETMDNVSVSNTMSQISLVRLKSDSNTMSEFDEIESQVFPTPDLESQSSSDDTPLTNPSHVSPSKLRSSEGSSASSDGTTTTHTTTQSHGTMNKKKVNIYPKHKKNTKLTSTDDDTTSTTETQPVMRIGHIKHAHHTKPALSQLRWSNVHDSDINTSLTSTDDNSTSDNDSATASSHHKKKPAKPIKRVRKKKKHR